MGYISSGDTFGSPCFTHITTGANEYPNGTVSVSGTFRNSQQLACYYDVCLCDSGGGNSTTIGRFLINGGGGPDVGPNDQYESVSTTVSNLTGLKNKGLYIKLVGVGQGPDPSKVSAKGNITVNVATKVDSFNLTMAVNNSGMGSVSPAGTSARAVNEIVTVTATANANYHFVNWTKNHGSFANANANPTTFTMPSQDATVTANFAVDTHNLTVRANNSSMGSVSPSGASVRTPGAVISVSATASAHYHFVKWTKDYGTLANENNNPTNFTMPSRDAIVTANFAIDTHSLTVQAGTGGSVSGSGTYDYNSTPTITATASSGYRFKRWEITSGSGSVTSATSSQTTIRVLGNVTVKATFEAQYTVSSAVSPSGSGTVTLGKTKAYPGEEVTVGAAPAAGYQFSNWSTNVSGTNVSNGKFTMPASNITVTATFTKKTHTVTLLANPSAGGTPTANKTSANYGDSITLSNGRDASEGYVFDNWTSSDVTITNNGFTMPDKNVTVTANYHIGTSSGSLSKTSFSPGETITLTIHAEQSSYYHKYKLSFGPGMETELTTVPAGVSSVNILIPLAWSRMMTTAQKTGTLTLKTFEGDDTALGEVVIDGLVYNALEGIIPKLKLARADNVTTPNIKATKARYTITLPTVDSYTLKVGEDEAEDPPKTGMLLPGDEKTIALNTSQIVELEVTLGSETFTLKESVPSVWLLSKSVG